MPVEIIVDDDVPVTKYVIYAYPDKTGYLMTEHLDLRESHGTLDTCDLGELIAIRDYLPSAMNTLDNLIGMLSEYRGQDEG